MLVGALTFILKSGKPLGDEDLDLASELESGCLPVHPSWRALVHKVQNPSQQNNFSWLIGMMMVVVAYRSQRHALKLIVLSARWLEFAPRGGLCPTDSAFQLGELVIWTMSKGCLALQLLDGFSWWRAQKESPGGRSGDQGHCVPRPFPPAVLCWHPHSLSRRFSLPSPCNHSLHSLLQAWVRDHPCCHLGHGTLAPLWVSLPHSFI